MQLSEQEQEKLFENEARRIARELWPQAEHDGALNVDGRERDGIFETEECIHIIECTVSRGQKKAEDDAQKLVNLARKLQPKYPQKATKCWFITKEEPSADQRTVIRDKYKSVTALSFSQFQSKLIDVGSYLSLRLNYPFGSVRDPANPTSSEKVEYISLDLIESSTQAPWSVNDIRLALLDSKRFIVLGDYGSGKSMTLREIFRELRVDYFKHKTVKFPLYLNLRDHLGQTNPAEVLERHARNIGFLHPSHLVRAWRAGYVTLLIDGFDELTSLGIQGLWKRLHEVRFRAMEVVRQFVREQPNDAGLILAGRAHYFDSDRERKGALNSASNFVELTLNEFNDEQIGRYLTKQGLSGRIPNWMPSRPLLVGYLAASGVLGSTFSDSNEDSENLAADPAKGWNYILDQVCKREADIEIGIDGPTVRRILERLATIARQNQSGLGPLSPEKITSAFADICGYQPDDKGSLLLQRLPGLGTDRAEEGTRIFLDEDFADVCRVGDLLLYISNPFSNILDVFHGADRGIGALGVGLVLVKGDEVALTSGRMVPALKKAMESEDLSTLVLDLVQICIECGLDIDVPIQLKDVLVEFLELSVGIKDYSKLTFSECLFSRLALDNGVPSRNLPKFAACYIDKLEGRASVKDIPQGIFDAQCEFGSFSDAPETTNAIAGMDLPLGARVLLIVLKKIFSQSGSGRKENALQRGLDHHSRRHVGEVLRLLTSEGLIIPYKRGGMEMIIWLPDRSKMSRVQKLITAPLTCGDPLIKKASNLA